MASKFLSWIFLICALAPAIAVAQTGAVSQPVPTLSVGDVLRIGVRVPEPEVDLSGEFSIAEDGTIIHPLYRQVNVLGKPMQAIRGEIEALLRREVHTDPDFVIEPLFRIAVGGAVNNPTVLTLPAYTTVSEAVMQAGGPNEDANIRNVRVLRAGQEIRLDFSEVQSEVNQLRIRSGDQIIVQPKGGFWRQTVSPVLSNLGSVSSILYIVLRISRVLE